MTVTTFAECLICTRHCAEEFASLIYFEDYYFSLRERKITYSLVHREEPVVHSYVEARIHAAGSRATREVTEFEWPGSHLRAGGQYKSS